MGKSILRRNKVHVHNIHDNYEESPKEIVSDDENAQVSNEILNENISTAREDDNTLNSDEAEHSTPSNQTFF